MKIKGEDSKVKVISKGKRKAEVIVSMPGPNKTTVHVTRHLLRTGKGWRDNYKNYYED